MDRRGEKLTQYYRPTAGEPALYLFENGELRFVPLSGTMRFGRRTQSSVPDIAAASPVVSRRHGQFTAVSGRCFYEDLNSMNGTLLNGAALPAGTRTELRDGDALLIHGAEDEKHSRDVLLIYTAREGKALPWRRIALGDEISSLAVGREEELRLDDETVSRRHAVFFNSSHGWALIDQHSLNGVRVNQELLTEPRLLLPMDLVSISGYFFLFTPEALYCSLGGEAQAGADAPASETPDIRAEVPASRGGPLGGGLSIDVRERNVWHRMKKKTLLRDIRLEIPEGNLVLILAAPARARPPS